jgi:hypothetical protein
MREREVELKKQGAKFVRMKDLKRIREKIEKECKISLPCLSGDEQ